MRPGPTGPECPTLRSGDSSEPAEPLLQGDVFWAGDFVLSPGFRSFFVKQEHKRSDGERALSWVLAPGVPAGLGESRGLSHLSARVTSGHHWLVKLFHF